MRKLTLMLLFLSLGALPLFASAAASASDAEAQPASDPTGGGATAPPSASQGIVLQEVVVTAQKRSQNLQKVPIAITALTGAQLANRGVVDTTDLAAVSPGVVITQFGQAANAMAIYVRGIGQLDFAEHQESPVALYVDGAYVSFQGAAQIGLYDLEQLSVLRGPQGTLFGRNATGGVLQITTNKPTDHFTGYVQQTVGSFGHSNTEGAISGPLSDKLEARFSFYYNRNSPWLHNTLGPSLGADNTAAARMQLLYKFTASTRDLFEGFVSRSFAVAGGMYQPTPAAPNPANHGMAEPNDGALFVNFCQSFFGLTVAPGATNCFGYTKPGNPFGLGFQFSDPRVGNYARSLVGFTNTLTHDWSAGKFKSITNYTNYGKHYLEDDSDSPIPIIGYRNDTAAYQASEELQLNGDTQSTHWVTGLYALRIHGKYDGETPLGDIYAPILLTGSIYSQDVGTYALYGQVDYALTHRLSLTLGARLERDKKSIDLTAFCTDGTTPGACANPLNLTISTNEFVTGEYTDTEWSGNFQLQYQLTDDTMLYAGIRRGTKGAEISATTYPGYGLTFASILVRPEVLTDTEAGFKSEIFNHRLRLNGDVFYYHYQNYQAFQFVNFTSILFNAPLAKDYGSELSVSALLTPTLTADLGFAYLHTRVYNVPLPDGTVADQQQPVAPNISVTASLRKTWEEPFGAFFAEGDLVYVGSRYYGAVNLPELLGPKYVEGNVSAGYTTPDGKWNATLAVRNVGDRVIVVDRFDVVSSGGYTESNVAPPRWVDFQVRYNF